MMEPSPLDSDGWALENDDSAPVSAAQRPLPQARASKATPRPVLSQQLLQGHRMVPIVHNGTVYRLQATRQGKLILTK